MKKLSMTLLTFALLFTTLLTNSVFAANNDSQSFEKRSTKYGNQIFVDASVLNLFHYNEELTNHINTPGNSIVFYGVGLDKKSVYSNLFQENKVPMILGAEEEYEKSNKGANVLLPNDEREKIHPETGEPMEIEEGVLVQTDLTFYNYNGKIYVLDGSRYFPKNTKINVESVENNSLREQIINVRKKVEIEQFLDDINAQPQISLQNNDATLMTSIRKSCWYYDDSLFYDLDTFEVGRTVTDYLIYNAQNNDPDYDHLIIVADAQVYSVDDNRVLLGGFQGDFHKYYREDDLISGQPDTTDIAQQLVKDRQLSFTIGLPKTASFTWAWNSGNSASMKAMADKETGLYYDFIYGTSSSRYNTITGGGESVKVKYATMFKSLGTHLDVYIRSGISKQWFNENTWKWHSYWEHLVYEY